MSAEPWCSLSRCHADGDRPICIPLPRAAVIGVGRFIAGLALIGVLGAILMTDRELGHPTVTKGSVTPVTTNRIGLAFLGIRTDAPPTSGVAKIPNPQTGKLPCYLLPFEIISVHLVVVLIGAGYLARAKRRNPAIDVEAT